MSYPLPELLVARRRARVRTWAVGLCFALGLVGLVTTAALWGGWATAFGLLSAMALVALAVEGAALLVAVTRANGW